MGVSQVQAQVPTGEFYEGGRGPARGAWGRRGVWATPRSGTGVRGGTWAAQGQGGRFLTSSSLHSGQDLLCQSRPPGRASQPGRKTESAFQLAPRGSQVL